MSKQPTTPPNAATTTTATTKDVEPSSGDAKYDALQKALKEKGIAAGQFNAGDENWRKRALKFGTPNSEYEEFKETHKWIYDQPITPKTKEEQTKTVEESTGTGKVKA